MSFRRIIVTGIYRSGTTLLYNAVRLLAIRSVGKYAVYGCYAGDYDVTNRALVHVVKAAEYAPALAAGSEIIYIYRPLEEVRASMQRFGEHHTEPRRDTDASRLDEYVRWLLAYCSHGAVGLGYIRDEAPERFVVRVQNLLRFDLDQPTVHEAGRELARLVPPEKGSDPVTLMHAHHITSR